MRSQLRPWFVVMLTVVIATAIVGTIAELTIRPGSMQSASADDQ